MTVDATHVIEIEAGAGEPPLLPLTLRREVEPLSIGVRGTWRLEAPHVLDVHAFVYFDGATLFLQSANEGAPAIVDGHPVATTWTAVQPPCAIQLGAARLRFRSLYAPGARHEAGPPLSITGPRTFPGGAPLTGPLPIASMPPTGPVAAPLVPAPYPTGPYHTLPPRAAAPRGFAASYRDLSTPLKMAVIVSPFVMVSTLYLILSEDQRRLPSPPVATVTAAPVATAPTALPSGEPSPCPEGFVPYAVPMNGQFPCVPKGTPMPTAAPAPDPREPTVRAPSGTTLERQAVDHVAAGNLAAAADVYEQLRKQNPQNRTYLEAARILRAKADAGAP